MQKYYQTLSKEEKQKIKNIYHQEYQKSEINTRFIRLNIYSFAAIFFSIILLILGITNKNERILDIGMAIILLITALSFLLGKHLIKLNLLNKIALKNKT